MMKLELWIGRVEVLTPATDSGDTKAFTNVITWANRAENLRPRSLMYLRSMAGRC